MAKRFYLDLQCSHPGCCNRARVWFIGNVAFAPKGWLVMGKGNSDTFIPVTWCKHHAALARAQHAWDNWDSTEVQRELAAGSAL